MLRSITLVVVYAFTTKALAGTVFIADPITPSFGIIKSVVEPIPPVTVAIKNVSNQAQHLTRLQIGCGCLSFPEFEACDLKPNESVTVQCALNRSLAHPGRHVYKLNAENERSYFDLGGIAYDFEPHVFVSPTRYDLVDDGHGNRRANGTLEIDDSKGTLSVVVADSNIKCVLTRDENTPNVYKFDLVTPLAKNYRSISSVASFFLSDVKSPDAVIEIEGSEQFPVVVQPRRLDLGDLSKQKIVERSVKLDVPAGVTLESVTNNLGIVVERVNQGNGTIILTTSLQTAQFKNVMLAGSLTLHLKSDEPFIMELPVTGFYLEP